MNIIFLQYSTKERPVSIVPKWIMLLLVISIFAQVMFHSATTRLQTHERSLPEPLSPQTLNIIGMGDNVGLSKYIMLWLQSFDHQPGISIPFTRLNYDKLINWLDRIMQLDQRSNYALLSASRIYSEVPDADKQRKILEFVYENFLDDPDERWIWMAHAVYVARHKIYDNQLALRYAQQLRVHTTSGAVPGWARQLELFIYEDLDDLETAQILLGGLIESGEITDENEMKFLLDRLNMQTDLEAGSANEL